ncbi:23S rRNA m2A2503 methyltransferase [Marinitoga piezophila KA3]|uniref:Probable dual-specificity RNA methyltransferase RlmN n=1 Tax=Marinitoga piezophila (strain DSM 14283 / JCM 11233 / KA3) TaxID=443254 RepID=H2J6W0_MARPK|nr:23S rRNA (adenine(2503)-C(2))-methyltransferase RlmN [Marinitoga piezophila]AEX85225.1 23S rRNA m2A2503 methyltransferase [Marinitoga piezophila KA3]
MVKKNILDYSYEELIEEFKKINLQKFRVDQVLDWIFKKHVFDFYEMTNLSKEMRKQLDDYFYIYIPEPVDIQRSKKDKTTKFLWKLEDGRTIESVLLFYPNRVSACISSQVGCALKCKFCSTGASGFERDLSTGEIIAQVLAIEKLENVNINNIVLMGMGEPLLNYDNVIKAIRNWNNKKMKNLGARHITISTAGIADKIEELADFELDIRLSISLHAVSNYQRDQIMPINSKYPIEQVLQAAKVYQQKTKNRVTIEYIAIKGFNDTEEDAIKLAEILKGLKVMVNIIPVNPNPAGFERPSKKFLTNFVKKLKENGIEATLRIEKGTDIDAACGQLKMRKKGINLK